jgi:hypothetical protein
VSKASEDLPDPESPVDNEFVARDYEVDILEIVGAGAPNFDLIHSPFPVGTRIAWFV